MKKRVGKQHYKKQRREQKKIHQEALSQHYDNLTNEHRKSARIQLLIRQDGCCAICGQSEKDLKKQLCIDHCHITGKIRGLLCNRCNWLLGHAKDNMYILQAAIKYLTKFM